MTKEKKYNFLTEYKELFRDIKTARNSMQKDIVSGEIYHEIKFGIIKATVRKQGRKVASGYAYRYKVECHQLGIKEHLGIKDISIAVGVAVEMVKSKLLDSLREIDIFEKSK